MGMSTHIVGFKPPDEKWKKMKAIWDACSEGEIEIPKEVLEYFNWVPPDPSGVLVEVIPHKKYHSDSSEGFEIEIDNIPKDIKIIRFYNSW